MLRTALIVLLLSFSSALHADEGMDFFESKIRPVLVQKCYKCHSHEANAFKGGLALDTRNAMRDGGESGQGVVPGKPSESLILEAIRYESFEMPPDGKLSKAEIQNFEKWIEMGAPDPREQSSEHLQQRHKAEIDWGQARKHWAFQTPQLHKPPQVRDADRCQTPIDHFVQAKLEAVGLAPNQPADDRTLLRRLCFDLTGLPPTPEQAETFYREAADGREAAIQRLVDQLLASPQYGERWAALWLDVMRYAEDQAHVVGNNKSLFYPNAYLYRNWVIEALNNDLPYDQFIRLQLAADQITPEDEADDVALGFIGLGPKYYRRGAPEVMADEYEDRVDTVTRGLLGLTVACARCHDHKFDPIPTEDYYALAGVFASTEMFNKPLNDKVKQEKGNVKNPEDALHIIRDKNVQDLHVMIRGDVNVKGELVPRRFLQVLCEGEPEKFTQGSGRQELAEQIANPNNPLTARVIVNRIWGELMGTPVVSTRSNFGQLGDQPTHPQLLDDLAVRFMDNGWSLKWLQREIVLSATYQQASAIAPEKLVKDEANQLYWRMNRRRLSVEQWRDALLTVSGQLDSAVGGKSIDPLDPKERQRTVYAERSRFQLNPLLARFDFPDPNAHASGRVETTTPLQKLFVMNSPLMAHFSEQLAQRVQADQATPEAGITQAYTILFQRSPTAEELSLGKTFLQNSNWQDYAHVLLASNEFYILD